MLCCVRWLSEVLLQVLRYLQPSETCEGHECWYFSANHRVLTLLVFKLSPRAASAAVCCPVCKQNHCASFSIFFLFCSCLCRCKNIYVTAFPDIKSDWDQAIWFLFFFFYFFLFYFCPNVTEEHLCSLLYLLFYFVFSSLDLMLGSMLWIILALKLNWLRFFVVSTDRCTLNAVRRCAGF